MPVQTTFQRYELKYLLNAEQKQAVLEAMTPHMAPDQYGRSSIRSIYFDTPTFRLVRRSLERPSYKEKLRLRSYGTAGAGDTVFVELKKKYQSVVYKRRLAMESSMAITALETGAPLPCQTQIAREIDYFRSFYQPLAPTMFLSYQREAYRSLYGDAFRVTFDEEILSRRQELSLAAPLWGELLLEEGQTLMELKTEGGIPLWMAHTLTRLGLYKTTFSKYGTAYRTQVLCREEGGLLYA